MPIPFASLVAGFALVLALILRRHRAAQVLGVLLPASLALAAPALLPATFAARAAAAVTMFAPWLLLYAAAVREPPLRSRRMALYAACLGLAAWLVAAAPAHVWSALEDALPLTPGTWRPAWAAAGFTALAAAIMLLRWLLRGLPLDLGLALALAAVAAGHLGLGGGDPAAWLAIAIGLATLALVHAAHRMALLDALTGLPNRRALDETLARLTGHYALAMVDVDHFKQFNDSHGHDAGDRVLIAVAHQLARTRGAEAFRFGGEEFCLVFRRPGDPVAACEDARARIEAARIALPKKRAGKGKAVSTAPRTVQVTASFGLATRDANRRLPADVLKAADQCLYRAKQSGRNRVVVQKRGG